MSPRIIIMHCVQSKLQPSTHQMTNDTHRTRQVCRPVPQIPRYTVLDGNTSGLSAPTHSKSTKSSTPNCHRTAFMLCIFRTLSELIEWRSNFTVRIQQRKSCKFKRQFPAYNDSEIMQLLLQITNSKQCPTICIIIMI